MYIICLQDSSGSKPNVLETTYGDDLYIAYIHHVVSTVTQTAPTTQDDEETGTPDNVEDSTTEYDMTTVPDCAVPDTG